MHILTQEAKKLANTKKKATYSRFFRTGPGDYGEGDQFLGLTVPQTRHLVKQHAPNMTLDDVDELLENTYHEIRLAGVLTLVYFAQKKIYCPSELAIFYMDHVSRINSWDLVDISSEYIIGPYITEFLSSQEQQAFIALCIGSPDLWTNRIIILASFYQIKRGKPELTLNLAQNMLNHQHDLIHKALGWMLREVGKRCSMDILRSFLDVHAGVMPRTMLRYAIEKMPPHERRHYMQQKYRI